MDPASVPTMLDNLVEGLVQIMPEWEPLLRTNTGLAADLVERELLDTYHPQYLVHGHVHIRYGARERVRDYNGTTLINATERYTFEIPDRPVDGKQLGQVIYKTRQKREDPLERHC